MSTTNPVCIECKKPMTWTMNNVAIYRAGINDDLEFIIIGTQYRCSKCGATIVTDFGERFASVEYSQKELKKIKHAAGECVEII